MATTSKKSTEMNYLALISRTQSDVQAEQQETTVAQASIEMQQSLLSLQSSMVEAQSNLKKGESRVSTTEKALRDTYSSVPFSGQAVINARIDYLQAIEDLKPLEERYTEIKGHYEFMLSLQKQLFN